VGSATDTSVTPEPVPTSSRLVSRLRSSRAAKLSNMSAAACGPVVIAQTSSTCARCTRQLSQRAERCAIRSAHSLFTLRTFVPSARQHGRPPAHHGDPDAAGGGAFRGRAARSTRGPAVRDEGREPQEPAPALAPGVPRAVLPSVRCGRIPFLPLLPAPSLNEIVRDGPVRALTGPRTTFGTCEPREQGMVGVDASAV